MSRCSIISLHVERGFSVRWISDLKSKGGRLSAGLPHRHGLLVGVGACLSISKCSSNLAVLGKVEGGNLLSLLNLLLVGLNLALELVNQSLHPLVVLPVLVSSEGQLLDGPLGLAKVLVDISEAPGLSIQFRLELTDAGLHLDHGLPASLQGVDLGLISSGGGVLALGLKQLLVLLQVHGELLFATELISKAGSIHHGTGGLVLRHLGLIGHLVEVRIELSQLNFQLPLGGGDGLVDIGQVGKSLVGVSQFLLRSATLAVSGLQKGTSLLQAVLHGSCPPVASNLGVSSSRLGHGLFVDLGLSITHLEGVLLDGGLGLGVACNGVLKSQAKVGSVSLKLLLHPESLSLALGLSLKGSLHGVQGLGLGLLHKQELFLLLSQAALNLLPDSVEFQLAPQHLVLLLLKGGLGLLQSRLKLQLLGLQTLPDFVDLVDGAATLADLVHDVLDFVGEGFVLPADFLELEHSLLVGRLDLEQFRGGVASLLLADVKVEGQAVNLALPLADDLVKLLGLPVHGSVQDLGLVQAVGHVAALRSNLGLGLLHLVQLGVQVVNGSLSLRQSCSQLHLGHLELLTLGYSIGLILLAPALCLTLSLGSQAENVLTSGSLLVKGLTCTVKLVLQISVFSEKQSPLTSLVVAESLDVVELGSKCGFLLGQDVQVVVKVSNDAEKVRVLNGNLVLGGGKVTESQVGVVNLLVDGIESLQHGLVGLIGRSLGPHHLVSGSAGIGDLVHDLDLVLLNFALHFPQSINLL